MKLHEYHAYVNYAKEQLDLWMKKITKPPEPTDKMVQQSAQVTKEELQQYQGLFGECKELLEHNGNYAVAIVEQHGYKNRARRQIEKAFRYIGLNSEGQIPYKIIQPLVDQKDHVREGMRILGIPPKGNVFPGFFVIERSSDDTKHYLLVFENLAIQAKLDEVAFDLNVLPQYTDRKAALDVVQHFSEVPKALTQHITERN